MAPGGAIHVATDDFDYFRCIVGLFGKDPGFIEIESYVTVEAEQTDFERVFLGTGARIHRRSFRRV
jgi:tRNA G46 methylase TrmB